MSPKTQPSRFVLRPGISLIEVLIVIAIIGILIQLSLPAIQAAREAARRTQCANQMRQWALAAHHHHTARGFLPMASSALLNDEEDAPPNRQGWPPQLFAYIEETALAQQYDFQTPFYLPPNTVAEAFDGVLAQQVRLYYCPSDLRRKPYMMCDTYWRVRGNYVLNWGPVPFQTLPDDPPPEDIAPFGFTDFFSRDKPRRSQFKDFTDGLSKTLLLSEQIMHPLNRAWDQRGDFLNDDGGGNVFMTINGPNGGPDELKLPCVEQPVLPCRMARSSGQAQSAEMTDGRFAVIMAARSRHPGGVNVAHCDSSVTFVPDEIDLKLWQALSTMQGSE